MNDYSPKEYDSFIKYITDTTQKKVESIVPKKVNDYDLKWRFDIESICGMTSNCLKIAIDAKRLWNNSRYGVANRINIREVSMMREDYYREIFERELESKVGEMLLMLIKQIISLTTGERNNNEEL